jgi:hypothetical protein
MATKHLVKNAIKLSRHPKKKRINKTKTQLLLLVLLLGTSNNINLLIYLLSLNMLLYLLWKCLFKQRTSVNDNAVANLTNYDVIRSPYLQHFVGIKPCW